MYTLIHVDEYKKIVLRWNRKDLINNSLVYYVWSLISHAELAHCFSTTLFNLELMYIHVHVLCLLRELGQLSRLWVRELQGNTCA